MINRAVHFKMASQSYLKTPPRCSRFEKLNNSIRLIENDFFKIEGLVIKDTGNVFTEMGNVKSKIPVKIPTQDNITR